MIALLDNVTATIVGTAVLAMVFVMQYRAQDASLQRTIAYHAKSQALDFGQWLQDDMSNVGAGVSFGTTSVQESATNAEGHTSTFRFRRKMLESDPAPVDVVYSLVETRTIVIDGQEIQLYALERRVDGVPIGKSPGYLTAFKIDMLNEGGVPTQVAADARQLRVQFSTAIPFSEERRPFLREAHWSTTVPIRNQ